MEITIKKHLKDLENQAYSRNIPVFSEFLTLSEQNDAHDVLGSNPLISYEGGFDMAERRIIVFLPYAEYELSKEDNPITCLMVKPLNLKFRSMPTHRDFLGSVLGLGIKRSMIGDIVINEDCAYIFCLDHICPYIIDNLTQVGSSPVSVEICTNMNFESTIKTQEVHATVASLRLDNICCAAYNISRSKMAEYIKSGLVYINGKLTESTSYNLKEGDIISIRHVGKFCYKGYTHVTKKDRFSIMIDRYI